MSRDWDQIVREVLEEARKAAGGGAALADMLHRAGVGPEAGAYSESAVSNWVKGRTMPPGDVVLAAAALSGISLDQRLGTDANHEGRPAPEPDDEMARLRVEFGRLEALVRDRLAGNRKAPGPAATKDVSAAFATRSEAQASVPLVRFLARAERVDALGLSLNAVCQEVSDVTLLELIENGLHLRCLFLDPDGVNTKAREIEEGLPAGQLAALTRTNMHALARVRPRLSPEAQSRLEVRTYDNPVRYNLTIADETTAIVQMYLPGARGLDSPTLLIEARDDEPHGLLDIFARAFADTWEHGTRLD
jgi:transcriptional regulator with XRE-family HTH domain